jgi:hypothetical protein
MKDAEARDAAEAEALKLIENLTHTQLKTLETVIKMKLYSGEA